MKSFLPLTAAFLAVVSLASNGVCEEEAEE